MNFTYVTTMHKFDEKTLATLELTNSIGTTSEKFSLFPKTSSMGVIIGVIIVTIVIILGIFLFTFIKINKSLCFKDQYDGESTEKKSEDPEAQELAPKEKEELPSKDNDTK